MKFNFSKDWCEKMARRESGCEVTAGSQTLAACPVCRGSLPEKQWCTACNKSGVVLVERPLSTNFNLNSETK